MPAHWQDDKEREEINSSDKNYELFFGPPKEVKVKNMKISDEIPEVDESY